MTEPRRFAMWLIVWATAMSAVFSAAQLPPATAGAGVQPQAGEPSFERIPLTAGRSHVLVTDFDVMRIAVTNPATANADYL